MNIIGNYWERGNKNEIDIVASNDLDKINQIAVVKMNLDKAKMNILQEKSIKLIQKYSNHNMGNYLCEQFFLDISFLLHLDSYQ